MQNPVMKKAVMKKAPQKKAPGTPSIAEYNEKVKSLDPDDPALDDWVDLTTEDAKRLAARERKRVARALLEAAAALEGTTIPSDIVGALEMVLGEVKDAIVLAKRKQFDKAQDALQGAMNTAHSLIAEDMFKDADQVQDEDAGDQPSWLRATTKSRSKAP